MDSLENIADSKEDSVKGSTTNYRRFSLVVEFAWKELAAKLPKVVGFRKCSRMVTLKHFGPVTPYRLLKNYWGLQKAFVSSVRMDVGVEENNASPCSALVNGQMRGLLAGNLWFVFLERSLSPCRLQLSVFALAGLRKKA